MRRGLRRGLPGVIFPVSLHTLGSSIAAGRLQWTIALPCCGGTLAGMPAGRHVATRTADTAIHRAFAVVAALVAALVAAGMLAATLFPAMRLH